MKTLERPELTYDGFGINGPDEYRSRIATFTNHEHGDKYGHLLASAPALLEALQECLAWFDLDPHRTRPIMAKDSAVGLHMIEQARAAIAQATGATKEQTI